MTDTNAGDATMIAPGVGQGDATVISRAVGDATVVVSRPGAATVAAGQLATVDLGPLKPCLPERLFTKDRRIHLAPPEIIRDLPRLKSLLFSFQQRITSTPVTHQPDKPLTNRPIDHSLLLVGRRELRSNNSWMHNSERLLKGRERCTLLIHPADAARHGIADGRKVQVTSRTGTIALPAEISPVKWVKEAGLPLPGPRKWADSIIPVWNAR